MKQNLFPRIYWLTSVGIYLLVSLLTSQWRYSWVIIAAAAVIYPFVFVFRNENKG